MRLASLLLLVPCLAACAAPVATNPAAPGALATSWRGTFGDSHCSPGEVVVFLEEGSEASTYRGSMYFESDNLHLRATYHVDAKLEDGVLVLDQHEIEESDPMIGNGVWCQGTYALAVGQSDDKQELAGTYEGGNCLCDGSAKLAPYE